MRATDYGTRFAGRTHPYYEPRTGNLAWYSSTMPIAGPSGITPVPLRAGVYQPLHGPLPAGMFAHGFPAAVPTPPEYAAPLDDEAIRDLVYACIDANPTILPDVDVDVDVNAGVVTLKGRVPGKRTKHAVGDAAWWIPSVVDVNNQLQVSPRRERRLQRSGAARGAA